MTKNTQEKLYDTILADIQNRIGSKEILRQVLQSQMSSIDLLALDERFADFIKSEHLSQFLDQQEYSNSGQAGHASESLIAIPPKSLHRFEISIAIIADEFSLRSWVCDAHLTILTRHQWQEELLHSKPDFVLIESAWNGNFGIWRDCLIEERDKDGWRQFCALIDFCHKENIKTIFWNKEDPVYFDAFLPIAKIVDYVFTTDAHCVENYKKRVGHNQVFVLPFAAQPQFCNPIGRTRFEERTVAFAGSYYNYDHDQRNVHLNYLLDALVKFRGDIFDRHAGDDDPSYLFPHKYRPFIKGRLGFLEMGETYKKYRVFLNVNTVTNSITMMARRVYELLASGTAVVSSPSEAISSIFGDVIDIVCNFEETNSAINNLLENELEFLKRSHKGMRRVLRGHTYRDRLQFIHGCLGYEKPITSSNLATVNAIIIGGTKETKSRINHKLLQTGLLKSDDIIWIETKDLETFHIAINTMTKETDYIFILDGMAEIGVNLLSDLLDTRQFQGAEITGKSGYFRSDFEQKYLSVIGKEKAHNFCGSLVAGVFLIQNDAAIKLSAYMSENSFNLIETIQETISKGDFTLYSADIFNYIVSSNKKESNIKYLKSNIFNAYIF